MRVKLARNLKTKQTKHFGFVEFESPELAYAVAEVHDTVIEGGKHLICKVITLTLTLTLSLTLALTLGSPQR